MFKFLIFIFLIQLVHWSVVSGTEPTAFGTDGAAIEAALKAGVSSDPTAPSGTCDSEDTAYTEIKSCVVPLNTLSTITTVPGATEIPIKATAANYYLIQSLLEKDSTFDDANLNGLCAGIKKTTDCIAASIAPAPVGGGSAGVCNGIAATHAATAIANFKAQYKLFYSVETFCSAATKKDAFIGLFTADTNKYAACKATPSGILMEAAFLEAVNHINALPDAAAIADLKAIIKAGEGATDAEKTLKLKSMCYEVEAAYNKVFRVYYQEKDKFTADCDDTTLKLWFNLIKAVIPPGVEKACTLPDPTTTLPADSAKPDPQATTRSTLEYFGFQHVRYQKLTSQTYTSCKDIDPLTDVLLLAYGGVMIHGDMNNALVNGFPFLKSVKVTLKSGTNTVTYEALADVTTTLPAQFKNAGVDAGTTAFNTAYLLVNGLKATITDPTSGLLIIINKVVSTGGAPVGVYGVTVSAPASVLALLGGGSMYSGCISVLNTADIDGVDGVSGTLTGIKTYDNTKEAGSGDLADAVGLAKTAAATTSVSPITTAATTTSDSCFIKAGLPSLLFAAAIVKICMM